MRAPHVVCKGALLCRQHRSQGDNRHREYKQQQSFVGHGLLLQSCAQNVFPTKPFPGSGKHHALFRLAASTVSMSRHVAHRNVCSVAPRVWRWGAVQASTWLLLERK